MKIFKEGDRVRLQLKDQENNRMLFSFYVHKSVYEELRRDMLACLQRQTYAAVFEGKEYTPEDYKAYEEAQRQ